MKKLKMMFLGLTMLLATNVQNIKASENINSIVHVGITSGYSNVDNIAISNKNIMVGYAKDEQFVSSGIISTNSSTTIRATNGVYLKDDSTYSNYSEALAKSNALRTATYKAVPTLTDNNQWSVYLGPFATTTEANNVASVTKLSVVPSSLKRIAILDGADMVVLFDNDGLEPQIRAIDDEYINLGSRKYRGSLEFSRDDDKNLTAVNVLPMNEYLYSVVPSEMPASWHSEALKAQACAARNYTITNFNKHKNNGFNVCDSVHCQVYKGIESEHENSTKAVNETNDLLIYYEDKPIEAVFFSSSGGSTENSENVWSNALPYYRSVPEINEVGAKEWVRVVSLQDIDNVLKAKNINIGKTTSVSVSQTTPSGRVSEMVIQGTSNKKVLQKEEVRTFFSSLEGGSLSSTMFTVTNGASSNASIIASGHSATLQKANPTDIVFVGKGWGHGVGMSQYGAKGMAEKGYTFDQILTHYYTGVEVK